MKLFKDLLVKSYDGDYMAIAKVISTYLRENTEAKVVLQEVADRKVNVIAIFGSPEVVINAHMDTVLPSGDWNFDPCILSEDDEKYYGLGTTDTKGNIYAALVAVKEVKPKNLMLLFSVDEESGSIESGVTHFFESNYSKGIKRAYIGEPTMAKEISKHKGYYSFVLTVNTNAGHSSEVAKLENNAIVKAATFIPKLSEVGFNVAIIEGGKRGNIIPSKCKITISIRSYENLYFVQNMIEENVPPDVEIKVRTALPSLVNNDVDGGNVNFWTEASLFQQKGISSTVIGAGSISQAHSENEFVLKSQIDEMIEFYKKLMGEI